MRGIALLLFGVSLFPCLGAGAEPLPLIFDTDMGNDIDDALALAVIHSLERRGETRLLGVTLTKDNPWAGPFVDLVNTFYGRGDVPIGMVRDGKAPEDGDFIRAIAEKKANGSWLYPRNLADGNSAPEAVALLRKLLPSQQDGSVVVVQVGFSTNLVRLIDSPADESSPLGGRELVARKVRLLSIMGGAFPPLLAEYNIKIDLAASTKLFAEWPTEVVASGFEIGEAVLYPAASIENDFGYVEHHPVADAYRAYKKMPYDRPSWDLTSVLYAVRPERGYFNRSPRGTIQVDAGGLTRFTPNEKGRHRFLILTEEQRVRVKEALVQLASEPPGNK
ncbi:MAG: nucleoside hydrolase [Bryobacterales bacterium]